MFEVRKAKRQRRPLKISLEGLSGAGKTFSALRLAFAMRRANIGKRIVIADSENESAGLYDGITIDGEKWEYEVCPIPDDKLNPGGYAECYEHLVGAGYDIVIFDSLSHAWHGAMEQVDRHARANKGDKFGGWANVTPEQRRMLTTLTDPRAHCIVTMRVKSEYERIDEGGRSKIKKIGTKADQRENTEYEFDAVIRLETDNHGAHVEKVRGCTAMDGAWGDHIGPTFWKPLFDWWLSAEPVTPPAPKPTLVESYTAEIAAAQTLDALKAVVDRINADTKDRLPKGSTAVLMPLVTARKAALMATTEGEQGSDPTPARPAAKPGSTADAPAATTTATTPATTVPATASGAGSSSTTASAPAPTEAGSSVEVGYPTTGPEFVAWVEALNRDLVTEGVTRKDGVKSWLHGMTVNHGGELKSWSKPQIERGVLFLIAREWVARSGKQWAQCLVWVNEHSETNTYLPADGPERLTNADLRMLTDELKNGAKHIPAIGQKAGAA